MDKLYSKPVKVVSKNPALAIVLFIVLLAFIAFGGYRYYKLYKENVTALAKIGELEAGLTETQGALATAKNENHNLNNYLQDEKNRNDSFQNQIGSITSSVGTLVKLSKTDKELLQKYSKVYFLNENYIPSNLAPIDLRYLDQPDKPLQIHTYVSPFLTKMIEAAATQKSLTVKVVSAYRSFGTQGSLKQSYKFTYGAGSANKFSADQGYSEHQLGTTVDLTTPATGNTLLDFEKDPAFTWLTENAYNYGFVLSYPKDNGYYLFEPWHWRFVGVALARKLHNEGKFFYDLDQRTIDEFLVSIFD